MGKEEKSKGFFIEAFDELAETLFHLLRLLVVVWVLWILLIAIGLWVPAGRERMSPSGELCTIVLTAGQTNVWMCRPPRKINAEKTL